MSTAHGRVPSRQQSPSFEPIANWTTLSKGDDVVIYDNDVRVTSGEVEMRDPDGKVFWIIRNDGFGRFMVHRTDGIRVFRGRRKAHSRKRMLGAVGGNCSRRPPSLLS